MHSSCGFDSYSALRNHYFETVEVMGGVAKHHILNHYRIRVHGGYVNYNDGIYGKGPVESVFLFFSVHIILIDVNSSPRSIQRSPRLLRTGSHAPNSQGRLGNTSCL